MEKEDLTAQKAMELFANDESFSYEGSDARIVDIDSQDFGVTEGKIGLYISVELVIKKKIKLSVKRKGS